MGVLNDFFIASDNEADKVRSLLTPGSGTIPEHFFPTLEAKNVNFVAVSALWEAVVHTPSRDALKLLADATQGGKDNESWVTPFPKNVTMALAALCQAQGNLTVSSVAKQWGQAMDWQPDDCAFEFLRDLSVLAQRAVEEGKTLYLWTSL